MAQRPPRAGPCAQSTVMTRITAQLGIARTHTETPRCAQLTRQDAQPLDPPPLPYLCPLSLRLTQLPATARGGMTALREAALWQYHDLPAEWAHPTPGCKWGRIRPA